MSFHLRPIPDAPGLMSFNVDPSLLTMQHFDEGPSRDSDGRDEVLWSVPHLLEWYSPSLELGRVQLERWEVNGEAHARLHVWWKNFGDMWFELDRGDLAGLGEAIGFLARRLGKGGGGAMTAEELPE